MRWRGVWMGMALAVGLTWACGDDSGGETTTISNDDDCASICGCDGCPETSGPTATSTGSSSGSGSASGEGEGTAASGSGEEGSTTASSDGTSTGSPACTCDPADPKLPPCPEEINCSDATPGDECCTGDGQLLVCVQNDIGVVWLPQNDC